MAARKRTTQHAQAVEESHQNQEKQRVPTAEEALSALRTTYTIRGREALRVKVLPALEHAINCIPSGPIRNKLTDANIILLRCLEELQS